MTKSMFDEGLGQGTLEIQDRNGKLFGRKAVNLDTFSTKDFAQYLRDGFTLAIYRLPLEFDAVAVVKAKDITDAISIGSETVAAVRTSDKGPRQGVGSVAIPVRTGKTELRQGNIFDVLDEQRPPSKKTTRPQLVEAWGYTTDMSYSRHFKADIRMQLAKHLGKDRSDVNDIHKLSGLGIAGPKKITDLFTHFNITHLPMRPNFAKMRFKQFVGLLHFENTKRIDA